MTTGAHYFFTARRYMIRMDTKDFEQSERLTRCASVIGLTAEGFRNRFTSVVAHEWGLSLRSATEQGIGCA
jgi:hypothetical protein